MLALILAAVAVMLCCAFLEEFVYLLVFLSPLLIVFSFFMGS